MIRVAAALAVLACSAPAAAGELSFLWPQVGVGAGKLAEKSASSAVHLDLEVGAESGEGDAATGFLFNVTGIFTAEERDDSRRLHLSPMYTRSIGWREVSPFARLGVGPMLSFAWPTSDASPHLGGGVMVEAAVGLKSVVELYGAGWGAIDLTGLALGAAVGVRVNLLILTWLAGDWGEIHHSHAFRSPPAPTFHPAVPVGR